MYLYPGTVPRPPAQQHNESQQFFHRFHLHILLLVLDCDNTHNTTTNNQQTTNHYHTPDHTTGRTHWFVVKQELALTPPRLPLFFSLSTPQNEGLLYWYMSVGDKNCGRKNRKVGLLLRRGQREV